MSEEVTKSVRFDTSPAAVDDRRAAVGTELAITAIHILIVFVSGGRGVIFFYRVRIKHRS